MQDPASSRTRRAPSAVHKLARGDTLRGTYLLEKLLARGGMGEVWVATHVTLEARVAVKIMRESFAADPDRRARFEQEARVSARLARRSRHVVCVLDYGVEQGCPWFAMELVVGKTLQAHLANGPLPADETITILSQLARALAVAHEERIAHRDLKPGNILLTETDGERLVKLTDFGVAKIFGAEASERRIRTDRRVVLGTPHYMSPEQARADRGLDRRCDVWALATVAYECLTGVAAFKGATPAEVMLNVCSAQPPRVRHFRPELAATVDEVFHTAFAEHIEDRFGDPNELVDALAAALDSIPPSSSKRFVTAAFPLMSTFTQRRLRATHEH